MYSNQRGSGVGKGNNVGCRESFLKECRPGPQQAHGDHVNLRVQSKVLEAVGGTVRALLACLC